jgi:succinylglutamic semialdehyde dehydrogenase
MCLIMCVIAPGRCDPLLGAPADCDLDQEGKNMQSSANLVGRENRSPVDGSITWSSEWADKQTVASAADRAHLAFETWSKTSLETRIGFIKQYASYLQANRQAIARTITLESGKPLWESDLEVQSALAKVDNAIDAIRKRRWTTSDGAGTSFSAIRYKPLGMMVVLGPYNLPLHLPGAHIVPALLAGNTVLFKPSEKTPAVGDWILNAWRSTGAPTGVLEGIHGAVEQAKWAVDSAATAGVLFTGSYSAGKQLHLQLAGRPECLLALEMGGNNPLVVDRVQSRQAAIVNIIQSAFITSGQRCTCARRLIVVNHPENAGLIEDLSQSIRRIQVGNPLLDKQPFMGSLVSIAAAKNILSAQAELQSQGAVVLNEATLQNASGAIVTPGLVLLNEAHATDEEHFGPLLTAMVADDLEQAISIANQTKYGLAAGILTDDPSCYHQFLNHIHAGIVNWNSPTTGASGKLPFGGTGASGNHRPSGYFAADYCSYPVASIENHVLSANTNLPPGLQEIF